MAKVSNGPVKKLASTVQPAVPDRKPGPVPPKIKVRNSKGGWGRYGTP